MSMTLSKASKPSIFLNFPGIILALFKTLAQCLWTISFTREDFPEPETPVTQVNTDRGIFTSTFFKLFSWAPYTSKVFVKVLLCFGKGIFFFPLKYWPVMESLFFIISLAVPTATTCPPCSPAPGPISTIRSASLMVSSSCSTTITEFPKSRRRFKVAISLSLSL